MHIVCEHCQSINRIPQDKSHTNAKCGRCSKAVYSATPVNLSDASFFRYIEKNDLPVVVDFWAEWCGPCRAMAPVFKTVATQSEDILFAKVDTEKQQKVSASAGIRSLPTLVFFYQGTEVDRISGALREPQLKQWILQCLTKLERN
jgi:thioredoxin 2